MSFDLTLLLSALAHQGSGKDAVLAHADLSTENPVELGAVTWQRDHGVAFAKAAESKKPVLLLFQEIPG